MHRTVRMLPIVSLVLLGAFAFAGSAAAGAAAQPAKPKPVTSTACTPAGKDGYQLCSSDKGALQVVDASGGPPLYQLSLTGVRELRRNGTVVYRSEEQHVTYDLTVRNGEPQTQEFMRAGAVVVTDAETCTYDDRAVFSNNQVHREVSNLACGPSS